MMALSQVRDLPSHSCDRIFPVVRVRNGEDTNNLGKCYKTILILLDAQTK